MKREQRLLRSTAAMAVGLALLGGYVYFVEVRGGEKQARATALREHLLPFAPSAATELELDGPSGTVTCRKENGAWRVAKPVRTLADDTVIDRLLSDVSEAKVDRSIGGAAVGDLGKYGLERPTVLTVASGSVRRRVEVGKEAPTGSFVFARRDDSRAAPGPVLVVERRLADAAKKTLYDLREKSVLRFTPEDVAEVTFTADGKRVDLVRRPGVKDDPQPGWILRDAAKTLADRGLVNRSLDLLSYVRAEAFVAERPEHLESYGLQPPWGSARFRLTNGSTVTLLVGKKTVEGALDRYFARQPGAGPVFTINDNLSRDLREPASYWREKHAVDFERADVAELRIITPQRTVVCVKREENGLDVWKLAEYLGAVGEGYNLAAGAKTSTALRADIDRVKDLIAHLATLEAKQFVAGGRPADPRFGLGKPSLKVVAMDKNEKTLGIVSFGTQKGGDLYATSPHLREVFLASGQDAARFRVTASALASRE